MEDLLSESATMRASGVLPTWRGPSRATTGNWRSRASTRGANVLRSISLRRLDGTIARGDIGNAEKDLAQLDRWVAIPQWQADIAERRARLTSPK